MIKIDFEMMLNHYQYSFQENILLIQILFHFIYSVVLEFSQRINKQLKQILNKYFYF